MKTFLNLRILLVALIAMAVVSCAGGSKGQSGGKNCGCKAKAGMVGY